MSGVDVWVDGIAGDVVQRQQTPHADESRTSRRPYLYCAS